MMVSVRLFASLRELFGSAALERELPEGATVSDLLAVLRQEANGRPLPPVLHVAVNQRYASPATLLADGDVVALLPPVSGGAPEPRSTFNLQPSTLRFWITEQPLSLDAVAALVTAPAHGAIVLFSGTVRGQTESQETDYLEYEAYPEMAVEVLAQIGAEVQERWPQVLDVAIVHRVGRLEVGESSVMVAVATAHRQGAFDACAYAIERLKQVVPIWKKEVGPDGSYWVEGPRGEGSPPAVG